MCDGRQAIGPGDVWEIIQHSNGEALWNGKEDVAPFYISGLFEKKVEKELDRLRSELKKEPEESLVRVPVSRLVFF